MNVRALELLLVLVGTHCLALRWSHADEPFDKIRADIRQSLERDSIPSLAVAVVKDGKIVWQEGFGWANKEREIAATENTPYSIASISKPVTATALMRLVERGMVDLDRPANDYLGDAKLTARVGSVQDATVRRLANHTAGLPLHYQFFYSDEPHPLPARAESIRRYGHLLEAPGAEFQYANFGYGLLDEIISLRSGMTYATFLQDEVFQPLGMTHSAVGIPPGTEETTAARYAPDGSALPFYDFDHPGGSAVYSSAHDLARFALLHLNQLASDQRSILMEKSLAEMQRPTAEIRDRRHYGVGWFIDENEFGYRTVSHTGGMGGVRCRLVLVPSERIGVVTLCNASSELPLRIAREILGELLPDYGTSLRKTQEHQPGHEPGPPHAPPELVGYWRGSVATYVAEKPVEMWVQADGDVKIRLGGELMTLVNGSHLEGGLLTGTFSGDIGTEDANRRPYHLHLRTRLEPDRLRGALTAISLPTAGKSGNALSHWIELARIDPDSAAQSLFNGVNLDGWRIADQADFERHGAVRVEQGEIVLEKGQPATGISFAGNPPRMNYELSFEARRLEGKDFFCGLTFPVGDRYVSLILGGWGGGVTGLSNLDGASAVENETTGYHEFQQGKWYHVRLRVTPSKVEAWLDGMQLVNVNTAQRQLSIWWEQEPMRPLGIATWDTKGAVRHIWLKRLPATQ